MTENLGSAENSRRIANTEWGRDWQSHIGLYRFQQKLRNNLQSADTYGLLWLTDAEKLSRKLSIVNEKKAGQVEN